MICLPVCMTGKCHSHHFCLHTIQAFQLPAEAVPRLLTTVFAIILKTRETVVLLQRLAQHCMTPDPHHRPTFAEVLDVLEPLRDLAERGELDKATPYVMPDRPEISNTLSIVKEEDEEEGRGSK